MTGTDREFPCHGQLAGPCAADRQNALALFADRVRLDRPETAIVLGSGLGSVAERVRPYFSLPFAQLPPLAAATVEGHGGRVIVGEWADHPVLLFSGRLHFYEGHAWDRVLAPVRLAVACGVKRLILTNAAGGIRDDLVPGTLMAIRAHLDLTRPCRQPPSARTPYSARLLGLLAGAAAELGLELAEGTYAAVLGPNYETPAEIRAFRALHADAVGMSTAREIEAAAALGLECAAISCITNRAAGLSPTRLSHEEVLFHSRRQATRLGELLERILRAL